MQSIISTDNIRLQQLEKEWYGHTVKTPVIYSFHTDGKYLYFHAEQPAAVSVPPYAEPHAFTPELWKFDTAEFFIAPAEGTRYMEFNLCPNGAWWCCVFSDKRCADTTVTPPQAETHATLTENGWSATAVLKVSDLQALGIDLHHCRLAAAAILNSPDYVFLTTAEDQSGEPDFHRPDSWPLALLH